MLNRLVIGTLTTLNAMVTPLGGSPDHQGQAYKLETPATSAAERCEGAKQSLLGLKVENGPGAFVTVHVQGHLCSISQGSHPVSFSMILPTDLMDEHFLTSLPAQAAYVASGVPSLKHPGTRLRVKITRLSSINDVTAIRVEWLEDNDGRLEHRPMKIWLKSAGDTTLNLPWQKVEFSELEQSFNQPLAVAGQFQSSTQKNRASH